MSVPTHSRPGSVLDLNFDKISHKSSRWGDDDDLPDWDPHVPNDSGLHSLAVSSTHLTLLCLSNCKKKTINECQFPLVARSWNSLSLGWKSVGVADHPNNYLFHIVWLKFPQILGKNRLKSIRYLLPATNKRKVFINWLNVHSLFCLFYSMEKIMIPRANDQSAFWNSTQCLLILTYNYRS